MADERYEVLLEVKANNQTGQALNQLGTQIQNIDRNAQGASRSGTTLTTGMQRLHTAVLGAAGAFAGWQIVDKIGELNEIGDAANRAEETFIALVGGADEATVGIQQMREATMGIVDDMTLMNAANRLFMTGLADTTEQAAELTGIAVRLGGALGEDAAASIENLNAALLNNSFERLDMLGISAAAVRERVNELKEAGMDMSEAFAQATLEQGTIAVENLGEASEAAATNMARLHTEAQNAIQNVGQLVNNVLEGAATTVVTSIDFVRQLSEIAETTGRRSDLAMELLRNQGVQAQSVSILGYEFNLARGVTDEQMSAALMAVDAQTRISNGAREAARWIAEQVSDYRQMREEAEAIARAREVEAQIYNMQSARFMAQNRLVDLFTSAGGNIDYDFLGNADYQIEFFDPAQLDRVYEQFYQINGLLENARRLNAEGLFPDEQLAIMEQGRETAEAIARAAEQGAEAYRNMTLPQAFGEGSGNELLGGIGDLVLEALRERNNMDADELQQAADAYNLAADRITEASITMRENLVPILAGIAETQGINVAIQRSQQVEDFIRNAALNGLDPNSMVFQAGMSLSTGTLLGVDVQGLILEPFQNAFDEVRNEVMNLESETGAGAQALANLPEGVTRAQIELDELVGDLMSLEDKEYTVKVRVDADAPSWLVPLLDGTGIARVVRDNGGIVPGQDRRSGGRYQVAPT